MSDNESGRESGRRSAKRDDFHGIFIVNEGNQNA